MSNRKTTAVPTAIPERDSGRLDAVLKAGLQKRQTTNIDTLLVPTPRGPDLVPLPGPALSDVDPGMWQRLGKPPPGPWQKREEFPKELWKVLQKLPSKTDDYGNVLNFELTSNGTEALRSVVPKKTGGVLKFTGPSYKEYPTSWQDGIDVMEFSEPTADNMQVITSMNMSMTRMKDVFRDVPPPLYEDALTKADMTHAMYEFNGIVKQLFTTKLAAWNSYSHLWSLVELTRVSFDEEGDLIFSCTFPAPTPLRRSRPLGPGPELPPKPYIQTIVYRPKTQSVGVDSTIKADLYVMFLDKSGVFAYKRSSAGNLYLVPDMSSGSTLDAPKVFNYKSSEEWKAQQKLFDDDWLVVIPILGLIHCLWYKPYSTRCYFDTALAFGFAYATR